ncbi:MAG: ankyrin repeat domain-containing protein [Longimicrobiales bacterium]
MMLAVDDPLAVAAVSAIHSGDLDALQRLLRAHPELAHARLGGDSACGGGAMSRTLLHVVTDWPGHFSNGAAVVGVLVEAGADVNARFTGPHTETPLHWAASSDDVEVLDALLDAGADIEARGGVIGGGTPLADATAFAQWQAAHRLVERGARTTLFDAAALGLIDHLDQHFARLPPPSAADIDAALWASCHGGQRRAAEYLLERGADLNWIATWERFTPLDAATRSGAHELVEWLKNRGARSANADRLA